MDINQTARLHVPKKMKNILFDLMFHKSHQGLRDLTGRLFFFFRAFLCAQQYQSKSEEKMFNWSKVRLYRCNFLQNPYFSTICQEMVHQFLFFFVLNHNKVQSVIASNFIFKFYSISWLISQLSLRYFYQLY